MTIPALVVAGGKDQSAMSTRGPDWFTDAYHLSPAPKRLLSIADGEHTLGGIAGEAVKETTDEDPARVTSSRTPSPPTCSTSSVWTRRPGRPWRSRPLTVPAPLPSTPSRYSAAGLDACRAGLES